MRVTSKTLLAVPLIAMAMLSSCKKAESSATEEETEVGVDFKSMSVPDNFAYGTTANIPLDVEVLLLGKVPYEGAQFEVYLQDPSAGLDDPSALDSLQLLSSFTLNTKGQFVSELRVPAYADKIYLFSKSLGIPEVFELPKSASGFKLRYDAGIRLETKTAYAKGVNSVLGSASNTLARSWSNVGYPDYLTAPINVSARFLKRFQTAVPYKTLIKPEYLSTSIPRNIVLDLKPNETADVSITFMFATSANRNVLGYYWYNSSTPPASAAAITNKGYIFPSTSRSTLTSYSGLVAGETVKLVGPNSNGSFPPNTTIGFFLISNGFTPSATVGVPGTVNTAKQTFYSDKRFNNTGKTGNMNGVQERMVVLYDETTNKIVWAIEDNTDADFSDVAFFASWTPDSAVPKTGIPTLPTVPRTDKDYVFYPGKNLKGTLMFEDCWPRLGDFDMNDLVLNHQYIGYLDEDGKISDIKMIFDLRSISAQMDNSFGAMIPNVLPGNVESVRAVDPDGINSNTLQSRTFVLESGHTNDVVVKVFDKASTIMGGNVVNNVGDGAITRTAERFAFSIKFKTPVTMAQFNSISPFIIPNDKRSTETHLANKRPSVKASIAKFGTEDDNTSAGVGRYFLSNTRNSAGNLTWGIEIPSQIPYTRSGRSMTRAFSHFATWASSGGTAYPDWYTGGTGYRIGSLLIYQ